MSPDSLTGGLMPNILASVADTSTCEAGLTGPSTTTLSNVLFGPTSDNRTFDTYCPGCDKGLTDSI